MVDSGVGTTATTYDSAGRPASVTDAFGDVSSYSYDAAGRLARKDNPNGTYELCSYDNRNRASSIVTKDSSNAVLQSRSYTFDAASQITQVIEGGITTTFGYDLIGQLTSEVKSNGYSGSYTYDANGNRLTRTVNGITESYAYDAGDKLTAITGGLDPRTFTYDAAGRTTAIVRSGGTTAFTYDFESRVTSITKPGMTTNAFSYNGLDTRVGVSDSLGSRNFKRNGIGVTAPVLNDGFANYTPSGEVRGGVKTTFHSALKNADIQTSGSGAVASSRTYDAFGNDLSVSGTWKSPYGYAGQFGYQQDVDTGLKLLGHRYYDSDTGRFLTRDPIKDGRNWYGYCGNNPVSRSDPAGLFAFEADDAWYTRVVGFGDGIIDLAFSLDVTSAAIDLLLQKPPASVRIRQLLKTTDQVDMSVADYRIANVAGQVFGGIVLGKLQSVAQVQFRTYPHSGGGGAKIFSYGVDTKWRFDVHAWKAGVQQQPFYKWPHYHRPPRKGLGGTPGEGKGRHRPWQGW